MTKRGRLKGTRLTPRQKIFAKEVARTGNLRAATLAAYIPAQDTLPSEVDKAGEKLISEKKVQNEVLRILEKAGVSLQLAGRRHAEILKTSARNVRPKDLLTAIDMAYKAHRVYKGESGEEGGGHVSMLAIFIRQAKERGLELPKELYDATA